MDNIFPPNVGIGTKIDLPDHILEVINVVSLDGVTMQALYLPWLIWGSLRTEIMSMPGDDHHYAWI